MSTPSGTDPRQYLNDVEEANRLMLDGRQSGIWTAMPAIVQSVNLSAMTLVAQLAIQGRMIDEEGVESFVDIKPIQDVPICFPSAGGFTMTFPVAAGDEVLLVFANRCIDSWWQNGGYQNVPMEFRMHDLSDGFAIIGPRSQKRLVSGISSTDMQIRNDAGSTFLSIDAGGNINLTSPGNINLTGTVVVTGALTATGEITAKSGGTAIDLSGHKHTGVTTGGGTSGPPIP